MKPYIIFRRAAVTLQRLQSTGLHFQVEPVTLKFLDCEDCLTITVIPLLPCKAQQAVACIRCFKRRLVALFSTQKTGMAGRAGKGRTQRCLEAAGQPGRQWRKAVVGMYQPLLSAPRPKRRRGWGSLQAGHSGTGERIPAMALGTKRTPALPSVGSTEAG